MATSKIRGNLDQYVDVGFVGLISLKKGITQDTDKVKKWVDGWNLSVKILEVVTYGEFTKIFAKFHNKNCIYCADIGQGLTNQSWLDYMTVA